jgi:hypothetical protein
VGWVKALLHSIYDQPDAEQTEKVTTTPRTALGASLRDNCSTTGAAALHGAGGFETVAAQPPQPP